MALDVSGQPPPRRLRIVHVAEMLHPDAGGPATVAVNLGAAQASLGHHVTVVGHHRRGDKAASVAMFNDVPPQSLVHQELIPSGNNFGQLFGHDFRRVLHRLLPQTDILIAHGMWSPQTVFSSRLAFRAGVPYVIRPAGMLDPWSLRQKRLKKMLGLRLVYAWSLRHAAFIHATSEEEASNIRLLTDSYHVKVPVEAIPNGIFLQDIDFPPSPGSFHASFPALQGRPYVVFLGRLHHKKRADLLILAFAEIAARFPDLQLLIAGPDEGEAGNLLKLANDLRIAHRVHFTGPIYGRRKFELLADAVCFALPSEQENFGVAVAEAMAMGTPVVVSDQVQIFPEIARRHAGVVCTLRVESVAAALSEVLRDEPARVAMGAAGRQLTKDLFLWRNVAARSTERYARVLSNRSPELISEALRFRSR